MLAALMPPTGMSRQSAGSTARMALTALGGTRSAGKNFKPCAPASSAAKASVGVMTMQNAPWEDFDVAFRTGFHLGAFKFISAT